jgi:hypothetical protein
MEDIISQKNYRKEAQKAQITYNKIEHVWCPMLNADIIFNSHGFRHLIRKRGILRSRKEQIRRFSLIPSIKGIVEDPAITILNHRRIINNPTANFWTLSKKNNDEVIKVVIRQLNDGQKHFFSVY